MRLATLAQLDSVFNEPMSKERTSDFLNFLMAHETIATAPTLIKEIGQDDCFQLAVMLKRLQYADPEMDFSLQTILMTLLLAPNVGSIVMWAYTLVEETRRGGVVTVARLAELFPMGFPTEQGYHRIWDEQKHLNGAKDNWLDTNAAWHPENTVVAE